jgi:hypothetical protein
MAKAKKDLTNTNLDFYEENSKSSQTTFSTLIVSKVIDWAVKVRFSSTSKDQKFIWNDQQKDFLNSLLDNTQDFPESAKLEKSTIKKYIMNIVSNGLRRSDIDRFYELRNLLPLKQLGLEIDLSHFKAGENNRLISTGAINAGFYMIEAQLPSTKKGQPLKLFLKTQKPISSFEIQVNAQKISKRLFYITEETALTIECNNKLTLPLSFLHFKLIPITRNFFISRILSKLSKKMSLKAVEKMSIAELNDLWVRYDAIFSDLHDLNSYEYYIKEIEPLSIPTKEAQLNDINKWLIKKFG